jgi:hypothetical protein
MSTMMIARLVLGGVILLGLIIGVLEKMRG